MLRPQANADPEEWTAGFPRAIVAADGSFQVSTYGNADGAPDGSYVVLVEWRRPPEGAGAEGLDPETPLPDRLAGRYMDPAKSPLKALVAQQPNELPRFDLE